MYTVVPGHSLPIERDYRSGKIMGVGFPFRVIVTVSASACFTG